MCNRKNPAVGDGDLMCVAPKILNGIAEAVKGLFYVGAPVFFIKLIFPFPEAVVIFKMAAGRRKTREPFSYSPERQAMYFPLNLSLRTLTGIKNLPEERRILWSFVRPPAERMQCICTW